MGLRNALGVDIDPPTGLLVIGENGPDAPGDVPGRGPSGRVEWNLVTQAANMGWPYCIGNNVPYNDFNFATSTPGPAFDAPNHVNDSPNNTGLANLPPSQPAVVWYGITSSSEFPEVNTAQGLGSSSPGGGPVFHHDPGLVSDVQFPAYYDGVPFFFEWGRSMLWELRLDGSGNLHKLNRLFPPLDFSSPIDIEFGPDGALYVLEWGAGLDPNVDPTQELVRVEYRPGQGGQHAPVVVATATPEWASRHSPSTSRAKEPSIPRTTRSPWHGTSSRTGRWIRRIRRPRSRMRRTGCTTRGSPSPMTPNAAPSRTCRSRSATRGRRSPSRGRRTGASSSW